MLDARRSCSVARTAWNSGPKMTVRPLTKVQSFAKTGEDSELLLRTIGLRRVTFPPTQRSMVLYISSSPVTAEAAQSLITSTA